MAYILRVELKENTTEKEVLEFIGNLERHILVDYVVCEGFQP